MVVVVLVAILAAIALPAYFAQSQQSKAQSEVNEMFAEFKIREEQYKLENGVYLSTGSSETDTWPLVPSKDLQSYVSGMPATWTQIKFQAPESQVRCAYTVVAGPASGGTVGAVAAAAPFNFVAPPVSWFYTLAHCNMDNDATVDGFYFTSSVNSTVLSLHPGN